MLPQVALVIPKLHPAIACGEFAVQAGSALQDHIFKAEISVADTFLSLKRKHYSLKSNSLLWRWSFPGT